MFLMTNVQGVTKGMSLTHQIKSMKDKCDQKFIKNFFILLTE